jgi:sugar (pentulose or hexulose) kinase
MHQSFFNVFSLLLLLIFSPLLLSSAPSSAPKSLLLGVDVGTEGLRAVLFGTDGSVVSSASCPVKTYFPNNGWAEQLPSDWWDAMKTAVTTAIGTLMGDYSIAALCIDTTACSVVALGSDCEPLRPCLLWMDVRSAPQTEKIFRLGKGDPALRVNCNGQGPISAEWMLPKALWIKENEPDIWRDATFICEKQDYLNWKLTGRVVASGCNVAARWHWDARSACTTKATDENRFPGRPVSLLRRVGLEDLLEKWPKSCVAMGDSIGPLTAAAAEHLKLPAGIPVIQGGPDAYVGMIGLGCIKPGQLALITGSSHLQVSSFISHTTKGHVF